jgi:hypothetical protein
MVLVEAAVLVAVVGVLVYLLALLLLRPPHQGRPAPRSGTWRVAHYDAKGTTHVVVQRVDEGRREVLDEHVVASFRSDDLEYDEKFLAAMQTARQRLALFEAEDG